LGLLRLLIAMLFYPKYHFADPRQRRTASTWCYRHELPADRVSSQSTGRVTGIS
jgi:hypothetical protein